MGLQTWAYLKKRLQRSDMILVKFASVLLLISGTNAQFQVSKCPTNDECDLKGGKCYPEVCPRGLVKIGACNRGCVCCGKPCPKKGTEKLVCVNPGNQIPANAACRSKDNYDIEKK